MLRPTLAAILALALAPGGLAAQEGPRLSFRLGVGASTVPGYFGSGDSEVGPSLSLEEGFLSFGGLELGDEDPTDVETGWGFKGSFRFVPERSGARFADLEGLDTVEQTLEVGGGVQYGGGWYEAFATARIGMGGHSEVAGELGMDLVARPTGRLVLRAGPRINIGTDGYAETYFGVSDAEAAQSAFPAFDAAGGVLASGVEVGATYDLTDRWGLSATARYDRLQGDAAASPISETDDQLSATVELTRRFDFRF